ncbi:MAG: protein-L-isoaspartate(D-aspartate) O-methyltransferase [Deltaproteobacteria bacterium]|nr:protein-L-isoaspartate(D-aspartate) O-methyltransferase [Deltaproteobacteria bacterium]
MVRTQLRARGIVDERVLAVMERVPRHLFVDPDSQDRAYDDSALPIREGQTISQPYMVALMTQSLLLGGKEKVLEIGTGSGYQTAVLAPLADRIFSMERLGRLGRRAEKLLFSLDIHNVLIRIADGTHGWAEEAPYDAILVAAGAPGVPENLLRQLSVGGRLVIPLGPEDRQLLYRITRTKTGYDEKKLGSCRFVKLIGRYGWES